jgi:hypothetical protein
MDMGNIVVIFADGGWKYLTAGPGEKRWRPGCSTRTRRPGGRGGLPLAHYAELN